MKVAALILLISSAAFGASAARAGGDLPGSDTALSLSRDVPSDPLTVGGAAAPRIRATILYGAGDFSTFRDHPQSPTRLFHETAMRTSPFNRRVEDKWFAVDKAKHVAFSFLWTLGTQYVAVNKGGLSEHRSLPLSIASSATIGVTKEYYDLHVGPTGLFSVRDLIADAAGIFLAVGIILI